MGRTRDIWQELTEEPSRHPLVARSLKRLFILKAEIAFEKGVVLFLFLFDQDFKKTLSCFVDGRRNSELFAASRN